MYNSAGTFCREKYVYEQIFPLLEHFQSAQLTDAAQVFRNYPQIYASSNRLRMEYILLSDLTVAGYANWDRTTPLDFDKVALVLRNLAHFHAVSFALKQQRPNDFHRMTAELKEWLFIDPLPDQIRQFLQTNVDYTLTTLDKRRDRRTIEKLSKFREECGDIMVECVGERNDAVILHGDCWISNFMFKTNVSGLYTLLCVC